MANVCIYNLSTMAKMYV